MSDVNINLCKELLSNRSRTYASFGAALDTFISCRIRYKDILGKIELSYVNTDSCISYNIWMELNSVASSAYLEYQHRPLF